MRKTFLLLSFIGFAAITRGQVIGRFYYDSHWRLTKKDSAVFFREAVFDTIGLTFLGEVRDSTKDGKLIMKGNYAGKKKNGEFVFCYPSGQTESVGKFYENSRTGLWKYYYANGKVKQEVEFTNDNIFKILFYNDSSGKPLMTNGNGFWKEEYEEQNVSGKIINEGSFTNYVKDGEWICKLSDGQILFTEKYKNGRFLKGTIFNPDGRKAEFQTPAQTTLLPPYKLPVTEALVFIAGVTAEDYPLLKRKMPRQKKVISNPDENSAYPECGLMNFYKTVAEIMKYPADARRHGVEGVVYVEFVIQPDGLITDPRVVKGIGYGCDAEAVRAVMESSRICKWKPGTLKGEPVLQRYMFPIKFRLG